MKIILLVDDNEFLRTLMFDTLQQQYKVFEANNGQEGLNIFKNNPEIELIITDFNMPIMDGFEFVKNIRLLSNKVNIIVFSSSIEQPQQLFKATNITIQKFLQKSGSISEIEETVKDLIKN